jgi:hypothetical protein
LWSACRLRDSAKAAGRVDIHFGDVIASRHRIESSCISTLVRNPRGARVAMRNAPRAMQLWVGDGWKFCNVRNEICLHILGLSVPCTSVKSGDGRGYQGYSELCGHDEHSAAATFRRQIVCLDDTKHDHTLLSCAEAAFCIFFSERRLAVVAAPPGPAMRVWRIFGASCRHSQARAALCVRATAPAVP